MEHGSGLRSIGRMASACDPMTVPEDGGDSEFAA